MMNDPLTEFLTLVERFAAHRGISEARASTLIFNHGTKLSQLRSGKDIGVRRLSRATRRLAELWPADLVWPAGIPRPPALTVVAAEPAGGGA